MGIFDKLKKKKDSLEDKGSIEKTLPIPVTPPIPEINKNQSPQETVSSMQASTTESDQIKLKIDLMISEINNLKTYMEMINERLKIIEKKIDQKGTIRYV